MDAGVIVAGAGHAAGEFAFRLRNSGYSAPIVLVGEEAQLPYQRPPLSKAFLSGHMQAADLLLKPQETYDKADIGFIGGTRIESVDRGRHSVRLSSGGELAYDKLVLATGGRARRLACPGADLAGVFTLRTVADVEDIRRHFLDGGRLVIVGGGYVGLEVAAVAIQRGLDVTLIEAAPRVLARVAGMEISAFYEKVHRDAGVAIHNGAAVAALAGGSERPDRVGEVVLSDGRRFPADFVLVGVGLLPNVALAEAAGLQVDNGVWVDEYCQTADPDVLAIGDCSNHPSAVAGRRLRLESVPNAVEQARVAADTVAGKRQPYSAVPWFWSDQYELKLQAVGLSDGHDQAVLRGTMEARAFTMFYLRGGVIIAADSVNRPADFMAAKQLVKSAAPARISDLADLSRPLKDLLVTAR